jgi:hypothetical protein
MVRRILALSPLLSLHVHFTASGNLSAWNVLLAEAGLRRLRTNTSVPYDVVIIVPGMNVSPVGRGSKDPWSDESRRARNANWTESLQKHCRGQNPAINPWGTTIAVFGQPNAGNAAGYEGSVNDVAKHIASRALDAEPLPLDDALAVFAVAAKWATNVTDPRDGIPISGILADRAAAVFDRIEHSVKTNWVDATRMRLAKGREAFKVRMAREPQYVAKNASADFDEQAEAIAPRLRRAVRPGLQAAIRQAVHRDVISAITTFLEDKRFELETGFLNRSMVTLHAIVDNVKTTITRWSIGLALSFEDSSRVDFLTEVDYDDLPLEMLMAVLPVLNNFLSVLSIRVKGYLEKLINAWFTWLAAHVIVIVVVVYFVLRGGLNCIAFYDEVKKVDDRFVEWWNEDEKRKSWWGQLWRRWWNKLSRKPPTYYEDNEDDGDGKFKHL